MFYIIHMLQKDLTKFLIENRIFYVCENCAYKGGKITMN